MDLYGVDSLMAAAIGALGVIFIGALICLVLLCRKQHQRQIQRWSRLEKRSKKGKNEQELAIALGDIGLNITLEQFLNDEQWVEDASGLIPHCLAILRACHSLTEQLISLALKASLKRCSDRLIAAAKRIPSRVDDVIEAMYPPLDGRLLEARAATLVLAVGQMALLAQNAVGSQAGWIDKTLEQLDEHLFSLCEAVKEKGLFNREITVFL